jgi:hypothetical protein
MKHMVNWLPKVLVLAYAFVGGFNSLRNVLKARGKFTLYQVLGISAAVAAFILVFQKDFWLPFLGDTVLPLELIPVQDLKQDADTVVQVDAPPKSKVIFWAAKKFGGAMDVSAAVSPKVAYGDFSNSGVVLADDTGKATLKVSSPRPYSVGKTLGPKVLPSHVHYRIADPAGAWIGPVQTVFV